MNSPNHVAIIMDGNGRWGIKKKNSRNYGHSRGVQVVQNIINEAVENNIKYVTLYAFSTENWKRPKKEISFLMNLLAKYIQKELYKFIQKNIRLKIIGNINKFPESLKRKLREAEKLTKQNYKIQINIALNYGSKEEIIHSVKKLEKLSKHINERNISNYLYTRNIPDPEILIRTGNRNRLSNFLLWQLAYSEIYFLDKLWPDFSIKDLKKILRNFKGIQRNYGAI